MKCKDMKRETSTLSAAMTLSLLACITILAIGLAVFGKSIDTDHKLQLTQIMIMAIGFVGLINKE